MRRARYREFPAPSGGFDRGWTQSLAGDAAAYSHRVLPDGHIDLIWWPRKGELQLAGPDTGPQLADREPGDRLVGLRFSLGAAPAALGVPADAVRDARLPLRAVWGKEADALTDAVAAAEKPAAVLARAATDRIREAGSPDPLGPALAAELARGTVTQAADRLGFSERHLRRRSLALFGYGPKTLQRILRFQRALAAVRAGRPAAEAAHATGYSDQAHLAHEVRRLAGVPLTGLFAPGSHTADPPGGRPL